MILVIGATGHFGREITEALHAAGEPVRALSRAPERAALPDSVQVVRGDLADPATLPPALAGVTALVLVLPYKADLSALLHAAREAGVGRIVFLSSGAVVDGVDTQPDVIAAYHADVERAIAATGIPYTFLRLFFPAINSLAFAMQLKAGDVIRIPYASATSAPVHERDVADAVMRTVTSDGHEGCTYHLTGDESLTQADQVRILGEALDRPLTVEELDAGPVRDQMAQFMDADFVNALFDLMAATVGRPARITETLEQLIGRPPQSYMQWALDHAADFA
jgi:uncharacterized protein YbjT (DUF2867 family)